MELIEKVDLTRAHYLNSFTFKEFKTFITGKKTIEEQKKLFEKIKNYCETVIKTRGEVKRIYSYSLSTPLEVGGRLFCGNSIQGLPKAFRGFLMGNSTTDIDMRNAHPTILEWLCYKNGVVCANLAYYNKHRDEILSGFDDKETAKELFLKSVNDEKINKKEKNAFFKDFDREMKGIQRELLDIPEYQYIKNNVPEHKLYNFYGSAINRLLCVYENKILQSVISVINKKNIEVASLMFDGLMIYGNKYDDCALLTEIEEKVNTDFEGLNMKFTYKQHNTSIDLPKDFVIPDNKKVEEKENIRKVNNDNDACILLFEELKHCLKSYKGRLFYLHNNIWIYDEAFIDNILLHYILNSNIYYFTKENSDGETTYAPYSQNVTTAKHIREVLVCYVKIHNDDPELYSKFHMSTKGKLFFNDGMLDFVNKTFLTWEQIREQKLCIYTTTKINRDFKTYFENPNLDIVNEIKDKIFDTLYGEKTDKALHFLSRALAGHAEDKRWATYLGNRNCGKGVEYDLLVEGFENYVATFELGNLLYCRKTAGTENIDCSKKLYWLLDLEFVRLAVSQEIPDCNSGLLVNSKQLKKITGGGDTIVARRNYDRKDTHFKIDTSFYIKGNSSLNCDTVDCDETRVEFCSVVQFKTPEEIEYMKQEGRNPLEMKRYKVADNNIKDKCKSLDWKNAIVYLIYTHYSNKVVEIEKSLDIEDNSLLGTLYEKYKITYDVNDIVLCSDLHNDLQLFDKKKIENELKEINIFKKKSKKTGNYRDKWTYIGLKRNPEIDEDVV